VTPIGASRVGVTDYDHRMAAHPPEHVTAALEGAAAPDAPRSVTILVYSSHDATRARVITALGTRPAPGLAVEYVEASRGDEVVAAGDGGAIDLAILDGEAAPTGGMGLARQLKDELDAPPPVLLLVGRRDDAWLATWSRAERVVAHPIDAVQITQAVTSLLGDAGRVAATP
jgi:DNA-binding response OmpR family regulator